ncbi:glycosyltransferase family 8 protein [Xylocopilactobacillus apis]|uniref:Glucosyltransferase n=1 Tax=Xylocopilactobacillus apis TaxID=2932183 RepID=A0AAU9DBL6_9LACO|nr:glycosyltransferase family 8 protein [Xylocopilactobacillus apis]BDR55561.1 glucosyltransferase [Xylocopilactobacillus apis]
MNKTIPIFYGINDIYSPYLAAAMNSLIKHTTPNHNYVITVIHQDVSAENQSKLKELEQNNVKINFKKLENDLRSDLNDDQNPLRADFVTFTIYYRLFIADMFPEYDKGIYLDSDTIVNDDIAKLYEQELDENLMGAIPDAFITHDPVGRRYSKDALNIHENFYVNSGVLLMNLKELRNQHFSEKFLDLLNQYHFKLIAPDQDYINAMCFGKTLYLDPRWNIQPENMICDDFKPKIVHYNLFGKPWNYDNIPFEELFWNSSKETNYYESVLKNKKEYTAEQRKHDQERKDLLVQRIIDTPDLDVTFKKIEDQGVKIRV